jgi:hypothetical protein
MKTVTRFSVLLCLTAILGLAETFTGKLIDANCKASGDKTAQKSLASNCAPTKTTTAYAVLTMEGKIYRLDSSGNAKAAAMMQSEPWKTSITVNGSLNGQTVKVESIDFR